MKHKLYFFSTILALAFSCATVLRADTLDSLYRDFVNPPSSARPMVWWHWMNGNITREGIRKDIMWMDSVGVAGFHLFDVKRDTAVIVKERLRYMTPQWNDAFRYALHLADSLSMEVAVPSSPGWSVTGGPWVTAADAMKKIVWRELRVKGGKTFRGTLPDPYVTPGAYQNMRGWDGGDKRDFRWYKDIAVIAVKLPESYASLSDMGAEFSSNIGSPTFENMTDGDVRTSFPVPYGKWGRWVQYSFPKPETIRSLTLVRSEKRIRFGCIPAYCRDTLMVSDDGKSWRTVMGIPVGNLFSQTISFEPVTAKHFRVKLSMRKGSRIAEYVLYPYTKVNHAEEKAAYAAPHDLADNPTPSAGEDDVCTEIVDITSKFRDGVLEWKVPKGNWMIYRFGTSLTGKRNHPAPVEATGLEVDKLDPDALRRYFKDYIAIYEKASGGFVGDRGLSYMMVDSYEADQCNWTPKLREEFRRRMGYDMHEWLPALTGMIIGSTEQTEKFLWDFRTVLGELFTESYISIPEIISEYGFKGAYMEGHENARAFTADGMSMKSGATVPMAAQWMDGGRWDRIHEGRADIKESASVANIYGRKAVAAESFSINGQQHKKAWAYCPANLVGRANHMMAAGVSRFIIHESAHQPLDDKFPGLGLGPYGQWFNRHETWAYKAKPWMDYLARNCTMLQSGTAVSDILYYYGEDCCVTGLFATSDPDVPHGYGFDYVNPEILLNVLQIKGDRLVAPASGIEYRVLALHGKYAETMSLKVLRRIAEIARSGVAVCGNLPSRPASLMDSKKEFEALLQEIRSLDNVYEDRSVQEVVSRMGIAKDFDCPELNYVHRTSPSAEVYWVCNPSSKKVSQTVSLRCCGRKPQIWNPMTGKRQDVSYRFVGERTEVEVEIEGEEALIIVLGEKTDAHQCTVSKPQGREFHVVNGPWTVSFEKGRGVDHDITLDRLHSLTLSTDPQVRYFSGTATYKTTIALDSVPEHLMLDLGNVGDIAHVHINGKDAGIVWKSPWRVDVSGLFRQGDNVVEIEVVNRWVNRLIGEAAKPREERLTYTTMEFFKPNSPLTPSGLMGPVRLMEIR